MNGQEPAEEKKEFPDILGDELLKQYEFKITLELVRLIRTALRDALNEEPELTVQDVVGYLEGWIEGATEQSEVSA